VSPVGIVLLLVGIDRLLALGRPAPLRPVRSWWLARRPRLIAWVRSAPATYVYVAILFVTTWVLASSSGRLANHLLLEQSTNLHHLARDPMRVLISSAFWLTDGTTLVVWVVLLTLVAAPMERRIGSWRTAIVFGIGHVGATLLTAAGLWVALHVDAVERSVVDAQDVGASYGLLAVAAAFTYLLAPRLRLPYAAALLAGVAAVAVVWHTFTDFGHLLAVLLGLACYPIVARRARAPIDVHARLPRVVGSAWRAERHPPRP
jgi:rhomboid family protein